ncbi:5-(carboxyamino)imidazole ribonucleotide synthase, partial [Klebsiella quasipneumoniae]|nr:5-(carboxyamino)imidazole ribonucleotide synthase [Klebsiella quasipneumoniae]
KEERPGRKDGHLKLTDRDTDRLSETLEAIKPLLPAEYNSGLFWAQSQLA